MDLLSYIAMSVGKLMIVAVTGCGAFYILSTYYQDKINGLIAPTILTMVVAFSVAGTFTSVFNAVIDTMIQCYITGNNILIRIMIKFLVQNLIHLYKF
jgi:hypothetical protein